MYSTFQFYSTRERASHAAVSLLRTFARIPLQEKKRDILFLARSSSPDHAMHARSKLPPHRPVTRLQFSFLPANGIGRKGEATPRSPSRPERHRQKWQDTAAGTLRFFVSTLLGSDSSRRIYATTTVAASSPGRTFARCSTHPAWYSEFPPDATPRDRVSRARISKQGETGLERLWPRSASSVELGDRPFIAWQRCASARRPRVGAAIIRGSQQPSTSSVRAFSA